jgi:hypothetical protein
LTRGSASERASQSRQGRGFPGGASDVANRLRRACLNGARLRIPGMIFRHGGACPRRAMFAARTPPNDVTTPPRSSPPWSDVPGKTHWKHRSTRTSRMVARGRSMPHSGCEHSSTEASSVVVRAPPTSGLPGRR